MKISLKKLTLNNFKGIKQLTVEFSNTITNIYGDNGVGKTTVFDALTWILFNKDSQGKSDFAIKPQDINGEVIHNLESIAEGEFLVDETILTLKKVYSEKWTKKRGSAEAEFTGNETSYYINEVPTSKKEYDIKISSLIDENIFKTLTNPLYFNQSLKWQDRRQILISMFGNISDEDILNTSSEYDELKEKLCGRTIDEYKRIIVTTKSKINSDLQQIPNRIAEANLAIPSEISEINISEKEILQSQILDIQNEIILKSCASKNEEISKRITDLRNKRAKISSEICSYSKETGDKLEKANIDRNFHANNVSQCKNNATICDTNIKNLEAIANELRAEWHKINDLKFSDDTICPTCKQQLPPEYVEQAKKDFNTKRANDLEVVTAKGKANKATIGKQEAILKGLLEKISQSEAAILEADKTIEYCNNEFKVNEEKFENTKRITLENIDNEISKLSSLDVTDVMVENEILSLKNKMTELNLRISEIDKAISQKELKEKQEARIEELKADEKRLASEYAVQEKLTFLIEKFIKQKVSLLNDRINSMFKYAKFKLFETQINGGINECCEVTYNGVDYANLNNAAKINIGLDVINTLCNYKNITAPIYIDNAESITNILETNSQQVRLVVSEQDKILRIEGRN